MTRDGDGGEKARQVEVRVSGPQSEEGVPKSGGSPASVESGVRGGITSGPEGAELVS